MAPMTRSASAAAVLNFAAPDLLPLLGRPRNRRGVAYPDEPILQGAGAA